MPLLIGRSPALDIIAEARERHWVLPAFNSENLTTTEAVLAAAVDHGTAIGCPNLPLFVAVTHHYSGRRQTAHYTSSRDAVTGLAVFFAELQALCAAGSPYASLRVLAHLDHGQWDADRELLAGPLTGFSSIMFDASSLPFAENIRLTAEYVSRRGNNFLIEGACDEIPESGEQAGPELTTPERAVEFNSATGVDLIVPNVGTEHRSGVSECHYSAPTVRAISSRIGPKLCLHGTSSLPEEKHAHLAADGIAKANIWTALEREAGAAVFAWMLEHADEIVGGDRVQNLRQEGLLGTAAPSLGGLSLSGFAASARNAIAFDATKACALRHLRGWMPAQA